MAVVEIIIPRYYHTRVIDWLDENIGRANWQYPGLRAGSQEIFLNQLKNMDKDNYRIQLYHSNRLQAFFRAEFKYEEDAMAFKLRWL